jgi:hypothetical protein
MEVFRALTDPEQVAGAFSAIEVVDAVGQDWTVIVRPPLPGGFRLRFSVRVDDLREPEHARLRAWGKSLAGPSVDLELLREAARDWSRPPGICNNGGGPRPTRFALMTLRKAAKELGLATEHYLRSLVSTGRIKATLVDGVWDVSPEAVEEYRQSVKHKRSSASFKTFEREDVLGGLLERSRTL